MSVIGEQLAEAGRGFTEVARNPGLRRVNLALAGSVIGDWAYGIAVSVWAYQQGGAAALGAFTVVRLVVLAVLTPFAATLADRFSKKAVMVISDLIRAALVLPAALLVATDGAPIAIYALALVTSVVGTAFRPAQAALIPSLADDAKQLTGANVVASTIESLGFFVGPAIAGLLLAVTDLEVVYLLNAVTFLWSAFILLGVPSPAATPEDSAEADTAADEPAEGFLREVSAGFRAIAANPNLRLVIAIYSAQTVVAGASMIYEVALVFELLERGEATLGMVDAFLGVGGLIGGFVAMMLARRQRIATDFGVGVILWAAPLLLIVARPTLWMTIIAMVIIGVANSIVDVSAYTIIQRISPNEVMGRVFGALESLLIIGMAVGTIAMTVMVGTIGVRSGMAIVGVAVTLVAIAGIPRLRRIDTTVLAPPGLGLLRGISMLSVLPEPTLERLARALVSMQVPAGRHVFQEGDRGDRYWVIERGRAQVTQEGAVVAELGPGEGFGEIALLRDVPRTATVTALEDLSLVGLDHEDFVPAVTGDGASYEVAEAVVSRLLTLS